MIVLSGKQGKSIVLEKMINERFLTTNIVVVDTVNVKGFRFNEGIEHLMLDSSFTVEQVIDVFNKFHNEAFGQYQWVVFEINVPVEEFCIEDFLELEKKYGQKFVITVQDITEEVVVRYA